MAAKKKALTAEEISARKDELETEALKYGVDLDKRKSIPDLEAELIALKHPAAPEAAENETASGEDVEERVEKAETVVEEVIEDEVIDEAEKYVVAEGTALTSKKGILGPGEEVRPEWLSPGAFEKLTGKYIVKG